MAQPSKFVSANLNKSYGHPSSTSSAFSNGRPRSMVVLSRPRSSGSSMVGQKTPQKVSVPPPMNLPSLRKEHERFNPSSVPGSASRPGSSGPGSSTMGWTKPNKDGGTPAVGSGSKPIGQLERAVLLRGDEFPSLRATVASGNASGQKQKQKHPEEGEAEPQRPLDMRPHMRSSGTLTNGPPERNEVSDRQPRIAEKSRMPDGSFPGLFPLAPLSQKSDWADDERDTALGIPERGFSRTAHDIEGGSVLSREIPRGDLLGRDLSSTVKDGRDSSSWRAPQARDGAGSRDFGFDGDRMGAKASPLRKQMSKESDNGQGQSTHKDGAWNSYSNGGGSQDGRYHRKDLGYGHNIHNGRNMEATFNGQAFDHNMRGGDAFQSRPMSKGHPLNDPVLNFGREKRSISNGGKQYVEVPGLDITDPFSGAPIGEVNIKVFKKKDMSKQVAFYDPVRESFEAELERVQRMQDLERQRVNEEQARALELARREHEERERLIREEEERRWRVEEQARESAWRAEQEKLDAAKRIEEQKNAREEEKRRIALEEDRRKEAARKKLLELEARIAKRQAEVSFVDTKLTSAGDVSGSGKERDVLRGLDVGDWEDGERMVESITNTAASDTSSLNKFFDAGYRPHSSRDHSSSFMDRGTHANNWRREVYDHDNSSMFLLQNQESDHHGSRRGAFNTGINLSKKEAHGNIGPSLRPSSGGTSKPSQRVNDLRHARGNRWNIGGDSDYFNKNSDFDAEFIDDDKFGDITWGNGRSHRSSHAPYTESSYQNYEVDGFSSFERSRHSLRQPRVLPPPSISSMPKSSIGPATLRPSSPSFLDCEMRFQHDRNPNESSYDRVCNENLQQPGSLAENLVPIEQISDKNSQRCESRSSLSVSSPPASPTHLSHDDLDESESSQLLATSAMEEQVVLTQDKHVVSASEVAHGDIIVSSSSDSHGEDEWAAESHELIHQQDVYDEYDDEYQDEEEAHEGICENLDTNQEFEDIQSDVLDTTDEVDQDVSGFDEGDEVRIPNNDEFENTCRSSEMTVVGVQSASVGATQELIHSGGIGMGTENAFTEGTVNEFSRKINETEKALQELVLDPVLSTSYPPDATSNLGTSVQHPVLSGLISTIPSTSSVQPIRPSISTLRSQPELPVKLQFGLFSGPPLIPCPVPTIQIGSIQMPLHPHPQVGPIAQIHPSQPSFFQFGQLRYPSPISQGILPLAPLSMSFVQAPSPSNYFLNQNHEGSTNNQVSQESSFLNNSEDEVVSASVPIDKLVVKPVGPAQDTIEGRKINLLPDHRGNQAASQSQTSSSSFGGIKKSRHGSASASQSEHYGIRDGTMKRNYRSNLNNREPPLHSELNSSQFFSGEKALGDGSKDPGMVSGIRGKRFAYPARNAGSRPFFPEAEASYTDLSGFRRRPRRNIRKMEFRVREGFGRMQNDTESFNDFGQDGKLNYNINASGNFARYRGKKDVVPSKSMRITIESQNINSAAHNSRVVVFDDKMSKVSGKDASSKKRTSFVGNSYESFEEKDYDDAPLQNGVVRVFKQPGIEAPSDEDDFIQVRSKRQMLNDRREQREKEIMAKSRGVKIARKIPAVPRSNVDAYLPNKAVAPSVADAFKSIRSNPNKANVNHFTNVEAPHVFVANVASQSLPPIGTAINLDSGTNSERSSERRSMSAISSCGTNFVSGLSFDNSASFPLGSWDNADINQQVMALTQSELDESMQSTLFDSHVVSHISHEPNEPVTSIATSEKTFMPSASPLDSLLAGEKIQFGAVTSPTILPPASRTVSNGIGPPVSGRSEVVMSPKLPTVENDFTVFFDQEKCPDESCTHIEDPETEAAASAVAVAAISNNEEIVGNRLGAGSVPVPDTKNFSAPVATMPNSGGIVMAAVQEVAGQLISEGSLTVSLPADLLVDSSSLPLWQPLPGPQSSSGTMLSHFPAAPSSHFPFFEMNPMLGGPLFAFGPHEGSPGTQDQAQRSATLGSGPLGAWPQCHPAMESFYIPPAGFAGPFIGPEGIPGGQGPHMVVYNHFNPVGQYGQVGLGFMGTTFIPSVKQPDWKHNPVSPVVGVGEGEVVNINVVSNQRNSPVIPAPIRHFAPGSSIVPTASPPLAMFDMTPFQSSADLPLQARWSHIPAPPIHSVLLPVQQHDGIPPSQFTRVVPVDTPNGNYWFNDPRLSKATDGNRSISVPKDASPQFLNEPLTSRTDGVQKHGPYSSPSSGNDNNSKGFNHPHSSMVNSGKFTVGQSFKPQPPQKPAPSGQQYLHPVGYSGRSQSSGPSKNFASSKVKQVYVAKSHTGGRAATS